METTPIRCVRVHCFFFRWILLLLMLPLLLPTVTATTKTVYCVLYRHTLHNVYALSKCKAGGTQAKYSINQFLFHSVLFHFCTKMKCTAISLLSSTAYLPMKIICDIMCYCVPSFFSFKTMSTLENCDHACEQTFNLGLCAFESTHENCLNLNDTMFQSFKKKNVPKFIHEFCKWHNSIQTQSCNRFFHHAALYSDWIE